MGGKGIRRGKLEEEMGKRGEEGRKEKKMRAAEDSRSCSRVLLGPQFSVLLNAEEGRRFRSIENEEGIISLPISNCGFD